MKWETYDEFREEYYEIVKKITRGCVEERTDEVADMAFDLFQKVSGWAKRSYTGLCFDCVYILANATGNKVSLPLLTYIGEQELEGRTVIPMKNRSKHEGSVRWFLTRKGLDSIYEVIGDKRTAKDVLAPWWHMRPRASDINGNRK